MCVQFEEIELRKKWVGKGIPRERKGIEEEEGGWGEENTHGLD